MHKRTVFRLVGAWFIWLVTASPGAAFDALFSFLEEDLGSCRIETAIRTFAGIVRVTSPNEYVAEGSFFFPRGIYSAATPFSVAALESDCGFSDVSNLIQDGADGTIESDDAMFVRFDASTPQGRYRYDYGFYGVTGTIRRHSVTALDEAPTVTLSGMSGSVIGAQTITATFSEAVTGFDLSDLVLSNATASALTGGVGGTYQFTLTPSAVGPISVSIPAGAAQDTGGYSLDNLASNSLGATVSSIIPPYAFEDFMVNRANALLNHQPRLSDFLRRAVAGHFNANVTRSQTDLSYASRRDGPTWSEIEISRSLMPGVENTYAHGILGTHSRLSDDALIGGMFQFDFVEEISGAASVQGQGWLLGPYFVSKHPEQELFLEGALSYGQSLNQTSPLGTYTDAVQAERWLATLGLSGQFEQETVTWIPFVDARYTREVQAAYVDGMSSLVPEQTVVLAQVEAGLHFEASVGTHAVLTGGVAGIGSHSLGAGSAVVPIHGGERGRVDLGVRFRTGPGGELSLNGFYDGVGATDYSSQGVNILFTSWF